jgi:DNA-binding transcriptional LysR family regulator
VGVELRALRWAIIAAQHKSLRRAAETLNIRQSTLSRGLRDLEHRLGAILFERTNGGTRLTLAGEEFLDAARRLIKEAEAIAARVKMRSAGRNLVRAVIAIGPALVMSSRLIGTAPSRNDSISAIGKACGWLAIRRCSHTSS